MDVTNPVIYDEGWLRSKMVRNGSDSSHNNYVILIILITLYQKT